MDRAGAHGQISCLSSQEAPESKSFKKHNPYACHQLEERGERSGVSVWFGEVVFGSRMAAPGGLNVLVIPISVCFKQSDLYASVNCVVIKGEGCRHRGKEMKRRKNKWR